MSGRVNKNRGASANIEAATTTLNERILKVSEEDVVNADEYDGHSGVPHLVH